jgi:hypothetical protein
MPGLGRVLASVDSASNLLNPQSPHPSLAEDAQQANRAAQPPATEEDRSSLKIPVARITSSLSGPNYTLPERTIGVFMFRRLALAAAVVAFASISLIAQQASLRPGTSLPIRIDQPVSGQTIQPGAEFSGSLAVDLIQNGRSVLPAGTPVVLRVSEVSRRGEGNSLPHITVRAIAILLQMRDGDRRIPILTAESMRTGAPIELTSLNRTARLLIGRHDHYPTTAGAGGWSSNYQDARFIPGDIIQLNLTEETLLP